MLVTVMMINSNDNEMRYIDEIINKEHFLKLDLKTKVKNEIINILIEENEKKVHHLPPISSISSPSFECIP